MVVVVGCPQSSSENDSQPLIGVEHHDVCLISSLPSGKVKFSPQLFENQKEIAVIIESEWKKLWGYLGRCLLGKC